MAADPEAKTYTAYNIWYEKPHTLYCINYKVGTFIPAGTEVKNVRVTVGTTRSTRGKPIISFTALDTNVAFTVLFNEKYHPGKYRGEIAFLQGPHCDRDS